MVSRIYYLSHRALPTTERWVEWTGDVDQPVSGEEAVALQTVASLADRYRMVPVTPTGPWVPADLTSPWGTLQLVWAMLGSVTRTRRDRRMTPPDLQCDDDVAP